MIVSLAIRQLPVSRWCEQQKQSQRQQIWKDVVQSFDFAGRHVDWFGVGENHHEPWWVSSTRLAFVGIQCRWPLTPVISFNPAPATFSSHLKKEVAVIAAITE